MKDFSALLAAVVDILTSFIGSMIALVIYMHYDLEGWYEQRRIRRGEKLDRKAKL